MKYLVYILLLIGISVNAQEAKIEGGAVVKFVNGAKAKFLIDLTIESGSLTQENSTTISLDGDLENSGVITSNGEVRAIGTDSQTYTILSSDIFNDVIIDKGSGTINLSNSGTWNISNDLSFDSSLEGIIFTRDQSLVRVGGSVIKNQDGFVDGPLAIFFNTGDQANTTFTVGRSGDYTPIEFDLQGTGGTAGYIQALSDPRVLDVLPSQLDPDLNVEREYDLTNPSWSSFDLGASRSFNMIIHYLNPEDIRNGANSNTFETAHYDTDWDSELRPAGLRTNTSVQSLNNTEFGSFIVGPENYFLELYSINSGSFSDAANWSLYGYGSAIPSPFAPRSRDIVNIGDSRTITLYENKNILSNRTLLVEQAGPSGESGRFIMDEYILSGGGTFTLNAGGEISLGDPNGITNSPTAAGNIQTFERNYNPGSHNDGSFGFTSLSSATVGDGLPSTVKTIWVETGADLLLLSNTDITEDVTVYSGTFNLEDKVLQGVGTPEFNLLNNSRLVIGSTNNLQNAIPWI